MFKHYLIKTTNYFRLYVLLARTLIKKECYLGPFVGEFGHLLSHIVPFVSFLSSKGVKVHLCGPKIHKPFFKNENGLVIYESFQELRDFYSEVTPHCNDPLYPVDIQNDINLFISKSKMSGSVFWNLLNRSLYWDGFCTWIYHNKFLKIYKFKNSLEKHSYIKPSIVLFARKKGSQSMVRGSDWNYNELISKIEDHCYRITILGHPAFSHSFKETKKVKVLITSNNEVILNECRKANFIINQFSGTHYLGVYLDTKILLLVKGKYNNSTLKKDIKYRKKLNSKYKLDKVNNYNQIIKKLKLYEKRGD